MKLNTFSTLAVITILGAASTVLAGCPAEKPTGGDAPYGQAAPQLPAPQSPPTLAPGSAPPVTDGGTIAPPGPIPGGPKSGAPMMGGGGDPMAPVTPTPELDKAIQDAESKTDKKVVAAAYASRGYARMTDDAAGQRVKYRAALEDFRTALKNDPANAKAKNNKAIIEEIYTSMGRPIPGAEPPGPKVR